MGRSIRYITFLVFTTLLVLAGCSLLPWQSSRYRGDTSEVYFLDVGTDSAREITYTLKLGDNVGDVYMAFVNYGNDATAAPALVSSSVTSDVQQASDPARSVQDAIKPAVTTDQPAVRRIEPAEIARFNNNPPPMVPAGARAAASPVESVVPRADTLGDSQSFYQYDGSFSNPIQRQATLRLVRSDGNGMTLNIWVDDSLFLDVAPDLTGMVTPDKIVALADAFLIAGEHNDIYDWVSTMLGAPWGPHGFSNLIDASNADTIDILLVDILRDFATDSGVIGYFWGKDNYIRTANGQDSDESNERIMFYLDAPMYGQLENGTWSATNSWPELVFSTLAHEFQHMIHFYQKTVLRTGGADSQTWLNEMLSLITEDIVAFDMGVPGPRGVDPNTVADGSDQPAGNTGGWLGYFNEYNDEGLYAWDFDDPIANYAVTYGLGSFLVRNYGGPELARAAVQNGYVGTGAIEQALNDVRARTTYREALSRWAAGVLISNEQIDPTSSDAPDGVYNTGTWFEYGLDGAVYHLGSINLFNHDSSAVSGPKVGTNLPASDRPAGSAVYFRAGAGLTGTHEWTINIGPTTDVVVVVKQAG